MSAAPTAEYSAAINEIVGWIDDRLADLHAQEHQLAQARDQLAGTPAPPKVKAKAKRAPRQPRGYVSTRARQAHDILGALKKDEGMTVNELAAEMQVTPHTLYRLLPMRPDLFQCRGVRPHITWHYAPGDAREPQPQPEPAASVDLAVITTPAPTCASYIKIADGPRIFCALPEEHTGEHRGGGIDNRTWPNGDLVEADAEAIDAQAKQAAAATIRAGYDDTVGTPA